MLNAIGYDETQKDQLFERVQILAEQLNLTIDQHTFPRLSLNADKLVLLMEHCSPLFADFDPAQWLKRRNEGKKQGLIRACKPCPGLKILDVTAGWGRDAALLASFGSQVVMLERNPMMNALLADALRRMEPPALTLSLISMDAFNYLKILNIEDYPDVIYIDPMHPVRQKSALVKKEMQALQQLIGADEDACELISLARTKSKKRVVVKWPQRLPPLIKPDASINGKTVRFDIYLVRAHSPLD